MRKLAALAGWGFLLGCVLIYAGIHLSDWRFWAIVLPLDIGWAFVVALIPERRKHAA